MSFRRSSNRHDIWRDLCRENAAMLRALPPRAVANEKAFRTLVTTGTLADPGGGPDFELAQLGDDELLNIWNFVQYKTEMDMDAATFDALNELSLTARQAFDREHP